MVCSVLKTLFAHRGLAGRHSPVGMRDALNQARAGDGGPTGCANDGQAGMAGSAVRQLNGRQAAQSAISL